MKDKRIVSIDAWNSPEGWTWNAWYSIGIIPDDRLSILGSVRKTLAYLRQAGHLSAYSAGRVAVEDDGYNLVVLDRGNRKPLLAIEAGSRMCG